MNSYYKRLHLNPEGMKTKAKIILFLERLIDGIYIQDDCVLCGKIIKRKEDLTVIAVALYGMPSGKYHSDCFYNRYIPKHLTRL